MARSDLLVSLVRAGTSGDQQLFRKTVEALIAEERSKNHGILAERLTQFLKSPSLTGDTNGHSPSSPNASTRPSDLWFERIPRKSLGDLILPPAVSESCRELIEEHQRADLLRSYNVEPRNRVLLAGEPGNGKTSLAEGIAHGLMVPMIIARYDGLIGSYLGETATRIRRLFDFARTRTCVLFFDEFDAVGKERGDAQETGEIKRVVSSLLLQIDDLPSHVVVVAASNHPELLDRAAWRRFQLRLELPRPTTDQIEEFLRRAEARIQLSFDVPSKTLVNKLRAANFAELEEFVSDVFRRYVLGLPDSNLKAIVNDRLAQWQSRFHAHG